MYPWCVTEIEYRERARARAQPAGLLRENCETVLVARLRAIRLCSACRIWIVGHARLTPAHVSSHLRVCAHRTHCARARARPLCAGEMLVEKPFFTGKSTINQLEKIIEVLGWPSAEAQKSWNSPFCDTIFDSCQPHKEHGKTTLSEEQIRNVSVRRHDQCGRVWSRLHGRARAH